MGNHELLAVKLALEEWRHWLEWARLPFLVWTDHKNLEYIKTAKRLNSRQVRWALFFTRFNFTLSYHPGAKSSKPDALSRRFLGDESRGEALKTILLTPCVVAALTIDVEERVWESLPPNLVPASVRMADCLCLEI